LIATGPTVPAIKRLQHVAFDTGSLLSTWVTTLHAEFDQQTDEPVPMPSFTLLQDWISR